MAIRSASLMTAAFFASLASSGAKAADPTQTSTLGLAVFSPLDNSPVNAEITHNVELNLFYGSAHALHGVALGLGANHAEAEVYGLQLAAFANLADGPVKGVQTAVFNRGGETLDGVQFGIVNAAKELDAGAQFGVVNLTKEAHGFQMGVVSLADRFTGFQLSVLDIADAVAGSQIACVNLGDAVDGAQIGFVNVADDVTGVQIGMVNVSSSNRYGQFGFVNIDSSNWFSLYAGYGRDTRTEAGIKTGSKNFFGAVALTPHGEDDGKFSRKYSLLVGFGARTQFGPFSASVEFDREVTQQNRKTYALPVGLFCPLGGPAAAFVKAGPTFDRSFNYHQIDWLAGVEVQFREEPKRQPKLQP